MQYTAVAIANLALQRIGAKGTIASLTDNSVNAVRVNVAWNLIFPMCLSERDWKFAKTKVNLQQSVLKPVFGYCFAYSLPADFLRLVKPKEIPEERRIAQDYGYGWGGTANGGLGRHFQSDVPVWPREVAPYIIETIIDANGKYALYLLTNYNSNPQQNQNIPPGPPQPPTGPNVCPPPVGITYIRLISDYTQLMPGFVDALAYRLAAELAIAITENKEKSKDMMGMYLQTLNGAQAQTECDDSLQDEAGSQTWVQAGRRAGWGRGW